MVWMSADPTPAAQIADARQPGRGVVLVHAAAIAGAVAVVVETNGWNSWDPWRLGLIAVFTVVSGLTYVETGSTKLKVSGTLLGLMLAGVLLGGGPAVMVSMTMISLVWFRSREAPHYFRNNFVTFMWFPLVGALFFQAGIRLLNLAYSFSLRWWSRSPSISSAWSATSATWIAPHCQ
jgi:hypothetical protein